ncbi:hypothetical protein LOTGIDRAFT_160625 [Lottia gigantea]|uniref:Fibrous sheath-interacting protein 2 n=1 Tax=Lottia gigantea TaxID=225164 RepID=V4AF28_LOTGI|nr:hypothetical protein LOTGIDRAFT_160625 [Lottia gigantea]ESO95472.1 hypothetical protein LOTGIDRAFT_160625 [Lottia gigantea]
MERLTLTPRHQSIDFRQCLPAGDILPSWSNLPLDTKLPMHKTPEGRVTLYTTPLSEPKYRSSQCIDFDLSDPLGTSLSTEYQSLHDPHLKSHFNLRTMRRHLVRNGFITSSGEVICTLREFNQYRQYLRRLCLLEVTQERKEELAYLEAARMKKQRPSKTEFAPKFHEIKKRQQEMLEKIKQRHEELVKMEEERLQKKFQLQAEKMLNYEEKRRVLDKRRDEILYRHKEELKRKNTNLLRSWIIKDQERNKRLEEQKTDMILHQTQKNVENWHKRKLHEYEKLEREKEVRERERELIEENVKLREKKIRKLRKRQLAEINTIKMMRKRRQMNKERKYAQRLAHKIVTGNVHPFTEKGKIIN